MAEWVWLVAIFVALTLGYVAGWYAGVYKEDSAPTENAWINERKYDSDCRKEISLRALECEHEQQMAMINRGCYDGLVITEEEVENDEQ